ncbi:hypothetical protein B0H11DRAFT_1899930 [Mycena galericulata]|nr:hypothetical protein B0H11DRAFT_1899930 [Mycena galericulata]
MCQSVGIGADRPAEVDGGSNPPGGVVSDIGTFFNGNIFLRALENGSQTLGCANRLEFGLTDRLYPTPQLFSSAVVEPQPKTNANSGTQGKAKGGSGFLRFGHSARAASAASDSPSSAPSSAVDSTTTSTPDSTAGDSTADSAPAARGANQPHTKHTSTHTHKPSLLRTLRGEATVLAGRVRRDPGRVERGRQMIDGQILQLRELLKECGWKLGEVYYGDPLADCQSKAIAVAAKMVARNERSHASLHQPSGQCFDGVNGLLQSSSDDSGYQRQGVGHYAFSLSFSDRQSWLCRSPGGEHWKSACEGQRKSELKFKLVVKEEFNLNHYGRIYGLISFIREYMVMSAK